MPHDATKVLLGTTTSSAREVDNRKGTIAAGLIVRLKSDETISIAAADGAPLGVSLGRSLSDTPRTAICRKGLRVPLRLTAAFTPTIGAQVHISDTTGLGIAAGAGATGMNATYATGLLTGVDEDGADQLVALIDMPGGL
jgi:hypothetical protein